MLTNLCGNALKFTERGTVTIAVRMREHGPHSATLLFQVSDTGIGIPLAHLASISEEFSQHSRDTNSHVRGTGLGLSICQRLLALHGSSLRVESGLGQGSVFSFELRLPVVTVPEARDLLGDIMAKHTLRGIRILVAMHERARESGDTLQLTHLLERWGADFELVESGERVVDRVQHAPYDLVLMDTELGCANGCHCTRVIRELPGAEPASLPIIALGSNVELGQRERLVGAGFTDFLSRPFASELLFRSIALHACIHRAMRADSSRPPRPRA